MPEELQNTQQIGSNPTPQNDEWKTKYEDELKKRQEAENKIATIQRQYDSVSGNLTQAVTDRKKAEADLKDLSENTEKTKAELASEKLALENRIKEKLALEEQLTNKVALQEEQIEVLGLIATEYPMLSEWFAKGRIATQGKKGDDLKAFLDGWKEDIEKSNLHTQRNQGISPKPIPGGQTPMTLQQIQDAKIEVLRTKGVRSKEYIDLNKMEDELFKSGKYK